MNKNWEAYASLFVYRLFIEILNNICYNVVNKIYFRKII